MIDFEDEEEVKPGAPPWMATFADLMSLLMTFFVLLLSFSEMDVEKYKQIAGSMKMAFGVQDEIKLEDIPKGTSIIAQEFSPGKPQPTNLDTVRQVTTDPTRPSLEVGTPGGQGATQKSTREALKAELRELLARTQEDARMLEQILQNEVSNGKVDIEIEGRSITVRIRENGSFPSGSSVLDPAFLPTLAKLREALRDIPGKISVEGHTDNVPISGGQFSSNWDLSASRALSVMHELIQEGGLDEERLMVVGYADTRPFTSNESPEGRALNRRVELVIRQGEDRAASESLEGLLEDNPEALDILGLQDDS
ncbi:flagellar motor protein MotB [Haliea atlantica]|jgi:chemotaxis protein MotB